MPLFDKDTFLTQESTGEMSTALKPMMEHEADLVIEEVEIKSGTISKGDRKGETWVALNLKILVDSDQARTDTNMDEPHIYDMIFVDLNDDGMLDTAEGKNVGLGRLRAAVGQNGDEVWSPVMLAGTVCRGFIVQEPDAKDDTIIRNKIKAYTCR